MIENNPYTAKQILNKFFSGELKYGLRGLIIDLYPFLVPGGDEIGVTKLIVKNNLYVNGVVDVVEGVRVTRSGGIRIGASGSIRIMR